MFRSSHPSTFKSKANENCIPLQKETQAYLTKKVIATERCKQLISQVVKQEALEKHYQFVNQQKMCSENTTDIQEIFNGVNLASSIIRAQVPNTFKEDNQRGYTAQTKNDDFLTEPQSDTESYLISGLIKPMELKN